MDAQRLARVSMTTLIGLHLLPTYLHGNDHADLGVPLPPGLGWFVYVVIVALPLLGAALLWTRWVLTALWMATLSVLAAAVFGIYHHYVLVSPDNVAHLPEGAAVLQRAFRTSAAWVAVSESVTGAVGLFCCGYLISARRRAATNLTA